MPADLDGHLGGAGGDVENDRVTLGGDGLREDSSPVPVPAQGEKAVLEIIGEGYGLEHALDLEVLHGSSLP
jgi:hypothetical protein